MGISHLPQAFAALPITGQITWGSVLFVSLLAVALLLIRERRYFKSRKKATSWGSLRVVSFFLLLPLTVAAVLLPVRSISGMEALAFFYGALFTLAPLIWFGGHVLLGRRLRPAISGGESLALATSGLFIVGLPAIALLLVQGPIFLASRGLWEAGINPADSRPLLHRAALPRLFEIPGAGKAFSQSLLAPPGLRVEKIERQLGDSSYDTRGVTHPYFCRNGEDLHLFWSAREETPRLRIYWSTDDGQRGHSLWEAGSMPRPTAETFVVGFRDDGLDLPAPIPRSRASLGFRNTSGNLYLDMLDRLQTGESFDNDCLMPDYRRAAWQKEGPILMLALMFYFPDGRPPLRAELTRPLADGLAPPERTPDAIR